MRPPEISCRELAAFDAANLAAVRSAFAPGSGVGLRQSWRGAAEADFMPGMVNVGWCGGSLLVFAELDDADIFTRATQHNQRMWELGDVFEIFLSSDNSPEYVEFHVTPRNWRLQLRLPDTPTLRRAQAEDRFEHLLLKNGIFDSFVWIQPEIRKWFVLAEIPALAVCGAVESLRGQRWRFSFSRYDYSSDRTEPVISSTSPHVRPDFHSREEWGTLTFV